MCCRSLTIIEWGNSDVTGAGLRNEWCSRKRPCYSVRARGKRRTHAGCWWGNQLIWGPRGHGALPPGGLKWEGGGLQAHFLSLHCRLPPSSVSPALGGCCLELLLFFCLFPGTITLALSSTPRCLFFPGARSSSGR